MKLPKVSSLPRHLQPPTHPYCVTAAMHQVWRMTTEMALLQLSHEGAKEWKVGRDLQMHKNNWELTIQCTV